MGLDSAAPSDPPLPDDSAEMKPRALRPAQLNTTPSTNAMATAFCGVLAKLVSYSFVSRVLRGLREPHLGGVSCVRSSTSCAPADLRAWRGRARRATPARSCRRPSSRERTKPSVACGGTRRLDRVVNCARSAELSRASACFEGVLGGRGRRRRDGCARTSMCGSSPCRIRCPTMPCVRPRPRPLTRPAARRSSRPRRRRHSGSCAGLQAEGGQLACVRHPERL